MKKIALCLLLGPLLSLSVRPQEPEDEPETVLAGHREKIEDALKALRRELREEPGGAAALGTIVEIERLALECKGLEPALAAPLPEAERSALVKAYRLTMIEFIEKQLAVERALLEGKAEAIKQALDELRAMEDSAHERFAPEDD